MTETNERIKEDIINMYLERFPPQKVYAFKRVSDRGEEHTFYCPLTKKEKRVIEDWKKSDYKILDEYLSQREDSGDYLWMSDDAPFIGVLESCDLNDTAYSVEVKVRTTVYEKEKEFSTTVVFSHDELCEVLRLFIKYWNMVSCNTMTFNLPEITAKMMKYLCWCVRKRYCCFYAPFIVEMTGIKDIVERIFDPVKDCLGLFDSSDEAVSQFVRSRAETHGISFLYNKKREGAPEYVCAAFDGIQLMVIQLVNQNDGGKNVIHSCNYETRMLCKHLNLSSCKELVQYLVKHYSVETAYEDILKYIQENIPEAIIEFDKYQNVFS